MTALRPGARKRALTAHVTTSLGWLGAVVAFLGLAITSLIHPDSQLVRATLLAMEAMTGTVIMPLAIGTLLTGLVSSLGSHRGLFQQYRVVVKLVLSVVATAILLKYTRTMSSIADLAGAGVPAADLRALMVSPVLHSTGAVLVLVSTTSLAVFKPRGVTRYGWRKQREQITAGVRHDRVDQHTAPSVREP